MPSNSNRNKPAETETQATPEETTPEEATAAATTPNPSADSSPQKSEPNENDSQTSESSSESAAATPSSEPLDPGADEDAEADVLADYRVGSRRQRNATHAFRNAHATRETTEDRGRRAQATKEMTTLSAAVDKNVNAEATEVPNPQYDRETPGYHVANTNPSLRLPELPITADPLDVDALPEGTRAGDRPKLDTVTRAARLDKTQRDRKAAIREA